MVNMVLFTVNNAHVHTMWSNKFIQITWLQSSLMYLTFYFSFPLFLSYNLLFHSSNCQKTVKTINHTIILMKATQQIWFSSSNQSQLRNRVFFLIAYVSFRTLIMIPFVIPGASQTTLMLSLISNSFLH